MACAAHSLSGSAPAAMGPQTPLAPAPFLAAEHAWQRPVQAVAQHTPSTQKPEEQSLPSAEDENGAYTPAPDIAENEGMAPVDKPKPSSKPRNRKHGRRR